MVCFFTFYYNIEGFCLDLNKVNLLLRPQKIPPVGQNRSGWMKSKKTCFGMTTQCTIAYTVGKTKCVDKAIRTLRVVYFSLSSKNRSGWMKSKEGAHANHPVYKGVHGGEHPQS